MGRIVVSAFVDRRQPMAIKAMTERDEENTDSVAAVLEGHVVL